MKTKTPIPLIAHTFNRTRLDEVEIASAEDVREVIEGFFTQYMLYADAEIEVRLLNESVQLLCEEADAAISFTRPTEHSLRLALLEMVLARVGSTPSADGEGRLYVLNAYADRQSQAA